MNADEYESVQLVTPPAEEPITLDEARLHLRLDGTDEDKYVQALVAAARIHMETALRRRLIATGLRLSLSRFPAEIRIPYPPLLAAPTITYIDADGATQTLTSAADEYQINDRTAPARIIPPYAGAWPVTRSVPNAVTLSYTAGLGAVVTGTDANLYRCIADHLGADANKPITGGSHSTYWRQAASNAGATLTWASGTTYRNVPQLVLAAVKLLLGHWFEHREAVADGAPPKSMPLAVESIIWQSRIW